MKFELGSGNLQRKLKKDLWAKSYRIGVFYPKEFIDYGRRELADLGYGSWVQESFGFEGDGTLHDVYRLNIHARFASRVLIRLANLRAGATEQLFSGLIKIPFYYWIPVNLLSQSVPLDQLHFDLRVFLKHSLVHHQGKAEKTFLAAILKTREAFDLASFQTKLKDLESIDPLSRPSPSLSQKVQENRSNPIVQSESIGSEESDYPQGRYYLHLEGNRGLVSIDTSGVSLQKRGYRVHPGPAPLAEHKAAALIQGLHNLCPNPGWVLDGMTGSGTQVFEAILRLLHVPPGKSRTFQYQSWLSFRQTTDGYWRKQSSLNPSGGLVSNQGGDNALRFLANDQSKASLQAFWINLREFQQLYNLPIVLESETDDNDFLNLKEFRQKNQGFNQSDLASPITLNVLQRDLFQINRGDISDPRPGWIMINPPYDLRLEADLSSMVSKLLEWIGQWHGCYASVLIPQGLEVSRFDTLNQPRPPILVNHGGREIVQLLLEIP